MNATDKQIGGTHYKTTIQPVQYIYANNLNFFEGNVIKYITRHRSKGGKADLEKAIHYIEMLMEFEYSEEKKSEVDPFMVDDIDEDGKVYFSDGRIGVYDPQKKSWSITYNFKEQ